MIQIDDVVVSLDVFREKFLCDLGACKGECCIEGDAGAPVEMDEVAESPEEPGTYGAYGAGEEPFVFQYLSSFQ